MFINLTQITETLKWILSSKRLFWPTLLKSKWCLQIPLRRFITYIMTNRGKKNLHVLSCTVDFLPLRFSYIWPSANFTAQTYFMTQPIWTHRTVATPHHLSDVRRGAPSWIWDYLSHSDVTICVLNAIYMLYFARSPVRRNWRVVLIACWSRCSDRNRI